MCSVTRCITRDGKGLNQLQRQREPTARANVKSNHSKLHIVQSKLRLLWFQSKPIPPHYIFLSLSLSRFTAYHAIGQAYKMFAHTMNALSHTLDWRWRSQISRAMLNHAQNENEKRIQTPHPLHLHFGSSRCTFDLIPTTSEAISDVLLPALKIIAFRTGTHRTKLPGAAMFHASVR